MNWIFGNHINTDLITPGRYNITTDPYKLVRIAFIEYMPEFAKKVAKGDFIVAGDNFGCGSSRETAAIALQYSHIHAVIAKSFARIFYRNCINIGLLLITADTKGIKAHDTLILDTVRQRLINRTQKKTQKIFIPPLMLHMHKVGGIIPYIQKHGLESLGNLEKFT